MNDYLTWALGRAREHTLALVTDVPPERMELQSGTGERHPAWLLGHLLLADTYLLSMLAVPAVADDFPSLLQRYGPKSTPGLHAPYDPKDHLIERLRRTNALRLARIQEMAEADLAAPLPDGFLAQAQPTIGHHLYTLVFHEGYHGGQLSSWRQAHGFPPVRWVFGPTGQGAG